MLKTLNPDSLLESYRPMAVALAGLAIGTACWTFHRSSSGKLTAYGSSIDLVQRMQADAQRVLELRRAPRVATERVRPNDELIKQVQVSLEASQIAPEKWIGNDPSPAVRIPLTPYKQLSIRLALESVTMKQLLQFALHLTESDPTLTVAQVRLIAPTGHSQEIWNVDLTVSYLLYAPHRSDH